MHNGSSVLLFESESQGPDDVCQNIVVVVECARAPTRAEPLTSRDNDVIHWKETIRSPKAMQRWDIKILIHASTTPHKERKNVHARVCVCSCPLTNRFLLFSFFSSPRIIVGGRGRGVRIKGKRDKGKIVC